MRPGGFAAAATSLCVLAGGNTALADEQLYPHHMMWGGGWVMGPIVMLVSLAIVVFLVVLFVRWLWPAGPSAGSGMNVKSALTILEDRYARGEIDKKEFEDRKRVIGCLWPSS